MGAIGGEELMNWEKMEENAREEKILVLVRLRPLNDKEISRNDVSDWECINDTTVLFRNTLQERSMFPTAYSFDRVFSGDATTRQVYDEGAKGIALSVVSGINSSIFAYGQTSSGKTYTMTGITEYTVADIYAYMQKHEERAFILKFSAIEIYNEAIRDLLSTDNIPLRVLDDPEKGTIIEKLTEETLRDWSHFKQLLSICEAQRKVGETSLNETSSRSHQILRLTIESSANEFIGKDKSTKLTASVNFVDLAGSERAAQALSVGQRLKEGCHINRSLLTLSTVIRKLSQGQTWHVNYRDSKLTRILQPCLGGNARTAIICTLSPAREHVEQSKNTLLFASCAKEVTTNAQVNVVMSDKALVKHLQKELARLENELRTPAPPDYSALLRKKDQQIEKLEKEVRDLIKQRDLAESRIQELLLAVRNDQVPTKWDERQGNTGAQEYSSESSSIKLPGTTSFTTRTKDESNNFCKEVRCVETDESTNDQTAISNGETESVSVSGPTETTA
ncbi:kinesin-like protein KIN-7E [Bidens hawaiensis]|uniref:kinesin-like protein KIN-7E n=1 Tax=Bidens hawaiensis TaxID=980011 RepID=UPI00404B23F4